MLLNTIYPDFIEDKDWAYDASYDPLINYLGTVAVLVRDRDYSGDTRILYHNENGMIGILIIGWGSCSGCDALKKCETTEEIEYLINTIKNNVKWFSSAQEALSYVKNKDWIDEYSWHDTETKTFVDIITLYLNCFKG